MEFDLHDEQHDNDYATRLRLYQEQYDIHQQFAAVARALTCLALLSLSLGATTAPGDQYFGRLKMSALRIRFETMQLKRRYETHELLPDQTLHLLLLTEDAYRDWARRYPKDPWLPSTGYALGQLYEELPGGVARQHAIALLLFVKTAFPKTSYARESRDQLHRGVPVKPEPAWASEAQPSPAATRAASAPPALAPSAASPSPSPANASPSPRPTQ